MRIYLSEKQGQYNPGFYPSGRVPEELAKKWVGDGIACPATDDNKTQWPDDKGPEPKPESAESIAARERARAGFVLAIPDDGPSAPGWDGDHYTPNASVKEDEDNGS